MPGCFVPRCQSGHSKKNAGHLFRPSEAVSDIWVTMMKKLRTDKQFDPKNNNHKVCEKHFEDKYIVKVDTFTINGERVTLPRQRWKLTVDAVPSIFENIPPSIVPKLPVKRREINRVETSIVNKKLKVRLDSPNEEFPPEASEDLTKGSLEKWWMENRAEFSWILDTQDKMCCFLKMNYHQGMPQLSRSVSFEFGDHTPRMRVFSGNYELTTRFSDIDISFSTDCMRVILDRATQINCCVGIRGFENVASCSGGIKTSSNWFSTKCEKLGNSLVCTPCKLLHGRLMSAHAKFKVQRSLQRQGKVYQEAYYYKRKTTQLRTKHRKLRAEMLKMKSFITNSDFDEVEEKLREKDVPTNLIESVVHSLKSAKVKSQKGMRYSTTWLLECLLLRIKSPTTYCHLRDARILPLPHPKTLQKLIAGQKCEFGISNTALRAIEKAFRGKQRRDRQGVLIFDEMKLRESLDFNQGTHQLDGYVDYGDEISDSEQQHSQTANKKFANHALVLMYRPLNDSWVQPIAAFATRDAAKGTILHKLVLQAIMKLESIGAEVLSIVCDGAQPNKSFWRLCGVGEFQNEIINKIPHPWDDKRFLYFTSDVPHIFKCIRNHFRKYTFVKYFEEEVSFDNFEKLFAEDSQRSCGLRKCPKLTRSHIWPNCFEKMVVPLATQLFSRSVATGLQFYREAGVSELEGSIQTQKFVEELNELFDALNTRFPSEGITLSSKFFKILEVFESKLSQLETPKTKRKEDKNILFASNETILSLKVTLKSTLEIIRFLINDLGFHYVLTAKLNQDCLEKFFGLIRAAGGREEHPTVSNFLQLFRLLSLYTPVKTALRGNIRSDEGFNVLVDLQTDLRESVKSVALQKEKREEIIDDIIIEKLMELENGFHPSGTSGAIVCSTSAESLDKNLIYYLAGFLCKKAKRLLPCEMCCHAICDQSGNHPSEYSSVTNLMNCGGLHYPTEDFFQRVCCWEATFCKCIRRGITAGDIIVDCLQEVSLDGIEGMGCSIERHSEKNLRIMLPYFLTIRLHFYTKTVKNDIGKGKATKNKRKQSKLV